MFFEDQGPSQFWLQVQGQSQAFKGSQLPCPPGNLGGGKQHMERNIFHNCGHTRRTTFYVRGSGGARRTTVLQCSPTKHLARNRRQLRTQLREEVVLPELTNPFSQSFTNICFARSTTTEPGSAGLNAGRSPLNEPHLTSSSFAVDSSSLWQKKQQWLTKNQDNFVAGKKTFEILLKLKACGKTSKLPFLSINNYTEQWRFVQQNGK